MVMKRSQLAAACMVAVVCLPHAALGFATLPSSRSLSLVGSRAASMSPSASSSAFNLRSARVTRKSVTTAQMEAVQGAIDAVQLFADAAASGVTSSGFKPSYSSNSYYATLGLFVLSFPGAWSLIKRSVQYKPIRKVFTTDGPAKGKEVRQTAAEITAYFKALNFAPEPTNDTVTFRGTMGKSQSQALYLTFCGFMSLAALAIVLTIMFPLVNEKDFSPWYYMCLASPGAGAYYWANAGKDVTVQIKMEESEDGSECDVTCLGTKEELERFCETMGFNEKGMIRVPGIMETLGDIV